jgi:hypothetical protein
MKKSQSRKYLSTTRCVNPGDPGCGPRGGGRWTKRDQKEQEEYAEMKRKERFGKSLGELPQIVKRRVIGADEESPRTSPRKGGSKYQSPASFELEKRTESQARRGSKVKKAKGGIKKKSVSVKAKYGIAKKASKKGVKK